MKKILNLKLLVLAISPLVLISCNSKKHEERAAKYQVTNPWKADQDLVKEYVAQIKAIQHIELRAFERGYLQNIFVDEGQHVKKDEKMFQIMPVLNKAEFKRAQAEYDLAQIEYKNTQGLASKNVVSPTELALAKAKFEKAKADLELRKVHLDFTEIKAPFDGIMDRFHVRLGSLVDEGDLLTTLSDNSKMWVYFNVSEADYLNLETQKTGDETLPVKLRMANGKIFDQPGKIDTVEADFNNETGNIAFRASFENPKGLLRHGETGNILVTIPLKDVTLIPQKATFEILNKKFVYVVDGNNKLKSKEITIQAELPHLYVVSSGLTENDKILIEGIAKVHSGQKIAVDYREPKTVVAQLDVPAE